MILSHSIPLVLYVIFLCIFGTVDGVIYSGPKGSGLAQSYNRLEPDFMIQKVSLTQKGYIQFLKYTSKVPTLTDYTFCIWVRSSNLTYNHPLLSYSKHEEERLIRVWVSERGKDLYLEIMEHHIFKVPVNLLENVWYHVCQSWSAQEAAWDFFLNGKLKSSGFVPKLKGVPIKGGGDIVVGQEYTDFDKGLDDGIEGDIFGFNFVLSSTSTSPVDNSLRRRFDSKPLNNHHSTDTVTSLTTNLDNINAMEASPSRTHHPPKGRFGRTIFQDMMNLFDAEVRSSHILVPNRIYTKIPAFSREITGRISNELPSVSHGHKPLGLLLVELSYDCAFKKGAPLYGKGVLISWTKSSVRVFGGAILKKVQPFCRKVDR